MKRKIIATIMIWILLFVLVGCTKYDEAENSNDSWASGYFTVIKEWGGVSESCYIVYANDTNVMYFVRTGGYSGYMTPLYNADGTLQIYNEH